MSKLISFFKEEEGATAVEYALMVALIAAVVVVGVTALGVSANGRFTNAATVIGG